MRLIDADVMKCLMEKRKQFFIDAYGGSFHCMSEKDKARCDEIDACIASIENAPTVSDESRDEDIIDAFMRGYLTGWSSAEAIQRYTEWLEEIIVEAEPSWICEDSPCPEWCDENCGYASIQAECLRHLYEVSKGGK